MSAHPEKSCPPARSHLSAHPDYPVSAGTANDLETEGRSDYRSDYVPVPRSQPRNRPSVTYSEAPREVLELLGVCATFYTQMQRMIPALHVAEYDQNTRHTVQESIRRVQAAAEWAQTVINTGDTTMDEALAKLLGGQS